MSHEVESMFFAGQTPWHGLGVSVNQELTSEEAISTAGLDWRVETKPLFIREENEQYKRIDSHYAVVRDKDNASLGVVGGRYKIIQNYEAFSFFDSVVGEKSAMYHTAGSLLGGRKIWLLAKLPGEIKVKDKNGKVDITEKYLLLVNSHDGSSALKMLFTPVRVVCQNTLNMSLHGSKIGDGISIRHTANATTKIKEAQKALGLAVNYYSEMQKLANVFANMPVSDSQMIKIVDNLFPPPKIYKGKEEQGEIESTKSLNAKEKIMNLWEGEGQGIEQFSGTAWGAYNVFTEYADHYKTVRGGENSQEEARLNSIWMGSSASFKQEAMQEIQQLIRY